MGLSDATDLGEQRPKWCVFRDERRNAHSKGLIADAFVEREHDNGGVRRVRAQASGHVESELTGHAVIEDDHIRPEVSREAKGLGAIRRHADRHEVVAGRDGAAKALADHRVVVGDDQADLPLRRCRVVGNFARALLASEGAIDVGATRVAQTHEDRAQRHALALPKTLFGKRALELLRLDHARVDEEQPEARIWRRLIENELQHPHEIERTERLHDVRRRPDRARERAALRIIARRQHHNPYVARRSGASQLTAHDESVARASFEEHVEQDDLRVIAARDGERLFRRRRFEHAPALRHERHADERADRPVVVRDEHRGHVRIRTLRLVTHRGHCRAFADRRSSLSLVAVNEIAKRHTRATTS